MENKEKNKGGRPRIELTEEQKSEVKTLAAVLSTEQIADYFGIGNAMIIISLTLFVITPLYYVKANNI